MSVTRESQYAVRAVYELARRHAGGTLVKMASIAEAQAIPERFLEVILAKLRRRGLIESKRGKMGGHRLACGPADVTVGQVLRVFDEDMVPVDCLAGKNHQSCQLQDNCPYAGMWRRAGRAVAQVYDKTTFADLLRQGTSC